MKTEYPKKIKGNFTSRFITGLLILLPVGLTYFVFRFTLQKLDSILNPVFVKYLNLSIPGLGLLTLIILIWLTGLLAGNYIGSRFVTMFESVIGKIPLLSVVFLGIKQISDSLFSGRKKTFEKVVLINMPFSGLYSIGFLTSSSESYIIQKGRRKKVLHVFIPTTPNPTTGFIAVIPEQNVLYLEMKVEDALKEVISLGVYHPDIYRLQKKGYVWQKQKKAG